MKAHKQRILKILGTSIIIILLLIPGVTLAQQVIKTVYVKMVTPTAESTTPVDKPNQELGDAIVTDAPAVIEQELNDMVDSEKDVVFEQQVYGNKLVYVDATTYNIKAFDLKTKETTIISNTHNEKNQLAMYKNHLAWVELNAIWAYDFKDGSIIKVVDQQKGWYLPDIYGDNLVYVGEKEEGIYLYDFKSGETTTITQTPNVWHSRPRIWKNIITWSNVADDTSNVYSYDLKKNKKAKITSMDLSSGNKLLDAFPTNKSILMNVLRDNIRYLDEYNPNTGEIKELTGLSKGRFGLTVDKYDGENIIYTEMDDTVHTLDLNTKEEKQYGIMEKKVVYGGVVFGIDKNQSKFKIQRN